MGKILYPVGTSVQLRKYPEAGVFEVVDYKKGEKYPYRLMNELGEKGFAGKTKFSIKGLKRFKDSVDTGLTREYGTVTEPTAHRYYYTQEDIDMLLREQEKATDRKIMELMEGFGSVLDDAFTAISHISETTDYNMVRIAKEFRSFNHDDD